MLIRRWSNAVDLKQPSAPQVWYAPPGSERQDASMNYDMVPLPRGDDQNRRLTPLVVRGQEDTRVFDCSRL